MRFQNPALLSVLAGLVFGASVLPAAEASASPRVVKLRVGVDNAMKFDLASIPAAPGEALKIVLTNASTFPKNVMGHNWVLLAAGSDVAAFSAAAAPEAASGYVPAKWKDKILAVIGLLGPNEVGEVTFTAPTAPGEYPFVCSFPGHGVVGMKGMLVVRR